MISLLKILTEAITPYDRNSSILQRASHQVFAHGVESPMVNVVLWDNAGSFEDPKKRNDLILTIEKHLKNKKVYYDYPMLDINKIMDGFKYYAATDKFVGPLPKFLFKNGYAPSLKNCKIAYELGKISKTIEIKRK